MEGKDVTEMDRVLDFQIFCWFSFFLFSEMEFLPIGGQLLVELDHVIREGTLMTKVALVLCL